MAPRTQPPTPWLWFNWSDFWESYKTGKGCSPVSKLWPHCQLPPQEQKKLPAWITLTCNSKWPRQGEEGAPSPLTSAVVFKKTSLPLGKCLHKASFEPGSSLISWEQQEANPEHLPHTVTQRSPRNSIFQPFQFAAFDFLQLWIFQNSFPSLEALFQDVPKVSDILAVYLD